ncbi:MAG: AraC family transcriptional regulator [Xanthomonadales bacterium]|nr:AraC family transcriptional regulator [Xanthomonadales bacterium]
MVDTVVRAGDDPTWEIDDRSPVARGTTTSITVRFLVAELDRFGVAPDALLQRAGVSREQLSSPEMQFPLEAFDQLWSMAASLRVDIGLRLVDEFPPGQMHVVTHLALRCASVGEALESVVRYIRLTDADDRMMLARDGAEACLGYANAALDQGHRHNPWIVEHFYSMCCVFMAQAAGRQLPLRRVQFRAPPQAPLAAYRHRFGIDPEFSTARNALCFDQQALAWPLQTHDQYLRDILEQFAIDRLPAAVESFGERVAEQLRLGWLGGRPLSLEQTARACEVSRDVLRSRLADAGLSFRQLKDDCRRDLARVHLAGRLSLSEIAYLLGFSEPAALQHAVKRWFGVSAGEFRRALTEQNASPSQRSATVPGTAHQPGRS